jgi:hypothetical protein
MTTRGVPSPHLPTPATSDEVNAMKACFGRTASPDQAYMALAWIVHRACGLDDLAWFPGGVEGQRASDFAAGKRRPALEVKRLIEMPAEAVAQLIAKEKANSA